MNGQIQRLFGLVLACIVALTLCDVAWAAPKAKNYTSVYRQATVFRDLDGDGKLGQDEPFTRTANDGSYKLPKRPNGRKGHLILKGGRNVITGVYNGLDIQLPDSGPVDREKRAPSGAATDLRWDKYDQSGAINTVLSLMQLLTTGAANEAALSPDQAAAAVTVEDFIKCGFSYGGDSDAGGCGDATAKATNNPRRMDALNRKLWVANGQLTLAHDLVYAIAHRVQDIPIQQDQAPLKALAAAITEVYLDKNRNPPDLTDRNDLRQMLQYALVVMNIRHIDADNPPYASFLLGLVDMAREMNLEFANGVSDRNETFDQYYAITKVAQRAAQDLTDKLEVNALLDCYTGAGLQQRIGDPSLTDCPGDREPSTCVLPNPSTETRTKACPSGQSGSITQTCVWSCPNPTGSPVQNCADTSNDCRTTNLNHPPVAKAQSVTATAGVALSVVLSATDQDNDKLTYSVVSLPSRRPKRNAAEHALHRQRRL
jgi:hypothetical protein